MYVDKKKQRSLIMCVTPLQMMIAEKIIETNEGKNFDLVVIALDDNDKYKHYYKRLEKLCLDSMYYINEINIKGFFNYIKELKNSNLNKYYEELYLASIDCRHFQYIVSKNPSALVYTFDDGAGNIISNDVYYTNVEPVKWKKIIWYFIGIKYYMKDIKEMSLLHYTLYENIPNIIKNTKLIKLYKEEEYSDSKPITKVIKIYLGQPLLEISDKINNEYVSSIIKVIKIDYYYPHPREKEFPSGDFEITRSLLVFEDYILWYLKNNSDVKVEVYSFISTALLNISHLERVSVNYIYNFYLYNRYKDFYSFVKKELEIDCVDFNV